MAVTDLWHLRDGETRSLRYGRGLQWQVRVPGHPSKSFRTKKAAQIHEAKLWAAPKPVPGHAGSTVDDLLDAWLEGKKRLSANGFSGAKNGAAHARLRFGDLTADKVHPHEVQAWLSGLTCTRRSADGSETTRLAGRDVRSKALSALRGAMDVAMSLGLVASNPCVGAKTGRATTREPHFLTVADLRRLADAAEKAGPMVWFLGTTGVRIGECCALDVGDLFERQGKWRVRVHKSKSGKGRDVPVPESVVAMLDLGRATSDPLFTSPQNGRNRPDNWRHRYFDTAKTKIGQGDLVPHDLRHTAASLMIRSGATVKDVQNALGHASAKMTLDLYAGWWDDGLDDVSARMNALMAQS